MDLDTRRLILPERFASRRRVHDVMTFDQQAYMTDARGNMRGESIGFTQSFRDGRGTYDSTGAFLVGELERLDQTMNMPLVDIKYLRDIDLRTDVTIADEVSSFTNSTFASQGGLGTGNGIGTGKSWAGKNSNEIANIGLDISRTPHNLYLWEQELKYSIPELMSAAQVGRPVDSQKFEGLTLKHQMDIDEMVYIGDTGYGVTGLVNLSTVSPVNLVNGASGFTTWANKTPDEILADVNTAITNVWQNSAWEVLPSRILIPPFQFGLISTMKIGNAANESVLAYILRNNVALEQTGSNIEVYASKWCIGAGTGGTIGTLNTNDRMVVYTKDKKRVRYPMTLLERTPVQFRGIYHSTTYYCRLGCVEAPYDSTIGYFDGL